jgi:outer membrane protein assembly factor BamB
LPDGVQKIHKDAARWGNRRGWSEKRKAIWQDKHGRHFASFVVGSDLLLASGDSGVAGKIPFLAAMQIENGDIAWKVTLPAQPIKGGTSIDHQGRIFVTLENGQTLCYAAP